VFLTGHSLGAARASILAGLMIQAGHPPGRLVTFGCPKPGFQMFADIIKPITQVSYRNGSDGHHDPVTDVPFTFPPEEYVHPVPLTFITQAPDPGDRWGMFAFHGIAYYQRAIRKLGEEP